MKHLEAKPSGDVESVEKYFDSSLTVYLKDGFRDHGRIMNMKELGNEGPEGRVSLLAVRMEKS